MKKKKQKTAGKYRGVDKKTTVKLRFFFHMFFSAHVECIPTYACTRVCLIKKITSLYSTCMDTWKVDFIFNPIICHMLTHTVHYIAPPCIHKYSYSLHWVSLKHANRINTSLFLRIKLILSTFQRLFKQYIHA